MAAMNQTMDMSGTRSQGPLIDIDSSDHFATGVLIALVALIMLILSLSRARALPKGPLFAELYTHERDKLVPLAGFVTLAGMIGALSEMATAYLVFEDPYWQASNEIRAFYFGLVFSGLMAYMEDLELQGRPPLDRSIKYHSHEHRVASLGAQVKVWLSLATCFDIAFSCLLLFIAFQVTRL